MEAIMIESNQKKLENQQGSNVLRLLSLLSTDVHFFSHLGFNYTVHQKCNEGDAAALFLIFEKNKLDEVYKITVQQLKDFHKAMRKLKTKRCRTTEEIKFLHMLTYFFDHLLSDINTFYSKFFEELGFYQLKPLFDSYVIHFYPVLFADNQLHQDYLNKNLPKFLTDEVSLLTLCNINDKEVRIKKYYPYFMQKTLLSLPSLRSLSFEELEFTRKSMLAVMEKISENFQSFRNELENQSVSFKNAAKLDGLLCRFVESTGSVIREEANRQLFINKAKMIHNGEDYVKLGIAITDRERLIDLMTYQQMLSQVTAQTLKQNFAREGNLNQGCLMMTVE
jgi:hypothetical protein